MTELAYIRALRDLYLQIAHNRFSRSDRQLAAKLYQRRVPIDVVHAALLLATARRICRNPSAPPLPPVRSLHYFSSVIAEITAAPLPRSYVDYLERKIAQHK